MNVMETLSAPSIRALREAFDTLMQGKQLLADGSDTQRHMQEQLERMFDYEVLTTRPSHFFAHPHDADPQRVIIGNKGGKTSSAVDLRHQPLPNELVKKIESIRKHLQEAGLQAGIWGDDVMQRTQPMLAPQPSPNDPPLIIPPLGDPYVAASLLRLLDARLNGDAAQSAPRIILFNEGDYWRHLLEGYSGRLHQGVKQPFGTSTSIVIADDYDSLTQAVATAANPTLPHTQPDAPPPILSAGATLLVATKTSEKIRELQLMLKDYDVRVLRLDPLANFRNPEEISGSFTGNAMEKITEARKALSHAVTKPDFIQALKQNHIDPQKLFILAEDSGVFIDDARLLPFMRDTGLLQQLGAPDGTTVYADQFPGVESGPFFNGALGERSFWDSVNHAFDLMHAVRDELPHEALTDDAQRQMLKARYFPKSAGDGTRPAIRRMVTSASVLALSRFDPAAPTADKPVLFFAGSNPNQLLDAPAVPQGAVAYTGHYLAPSNLQMPEWIAPHDAPQTQENLGAKYVLHYAARAQAAQAMIAACGMQKGHTHTQEQPLRLGAIQPHAVELAAPLERIETLAAIDFSNSDWVQQAEELCAAHDVWLINAPDAQTLTARDKLDALFQFSSLIVSKQLVPRDKDKTLIVDDTTAQGKALCELYDSLRCSGMVADQQDLFLTRRSNHPQLAPVLQQASRSKFLDITIEVTQEHISPLRSKADGFQVAVFCSATAKNQPLNDDAFAIGEAIAGRGYGLVYGAADREMMGSVRDGFLRGRKEHNTQDFLFGSSTDDIVKVESKDATAVIASLDAYYNAPHIYARMQAMFEQADAFAIIPGGIGTVQELAALLCGKLQGLEAVKDKPIVILNQPITISRDGLRQPTGCYDALINWLGKDTLAELGVQIVQSSKALVAALEKAKAASS
jgi:predicted Rossmann-fold nucleotide-binding protein